MCRDRGVYRWVIAGLLGTRAELPWWEGLGYSSWFECDLGTTDSISWAWTLVFLTLAHLRGHPGSTRGILLWAWLREGV